MLDGIMKIYTFAQNKWIWTMNLLLSLILSNIIILVGQPGRSENGV